MIRASKEAPGSDLKELYRLLVTSLRASSVHFKQQLSVESLTVGLWGLSTEHSKAPAPLLEGKRIGPADRAVVAEWLHWADVLLSCFDGGASTAAVLAKSLGVQESCVLHFSPLSQPLLPAHALVEDATRQQLLLLVRGTSGWADCLTDLVAHTEPLGQGHAHSGMLDCARAILQQTVPLMQQYLEQQQPGCYRIHCIGHSLGGGVAALAAYLMRNEMQQQLQAASGVMATGFGTPPVMNQQLAEAVSQWTRTLVHGNDMVPRTCVASLAVLRRELEAQKEAVFSNNAALTRLRDSGVLQVAGSFCSAAIASRVTPGVAAAAVGKSRWVSAGLVGAGLLVSKAKKLHAETLAGGATGANGSSSSAQGAAAAAGGSAAAAAAASAGAAAAAPPLASGGSSTTGTFSFAAMRQAVSAVAASTMQQQPAAQSQPPADAQQQQQQRYDEEEQAAQVHLFCPGQLWHLAPTTGTGGEEASYMLVQAPASCSERFGSRILVQRSMLSDHFLSEHMQALLVLQAQLMEQAAAGM